MCRNLRYNLDHLKLSDKPGYLRIVDSIVIGPNNLSAEEVERVLGINTYLFKKSLSRREELIRTRKRPKWWAAREADMYTIWEQQEEVTRWRGHSKARKTQRHLPPLGLETKKKTDSGLEQQFTLFSRFGSIGFDGINITLSQSDKWLKQAGIIDGWHITTTDTAIAFRKFSRGATRLGFSDWRLFMEDLASSKKLNIGKVWRDLEGCGKPGLNIRTG